MVNREPVSVGILRPQLTSFEMLNGVHAQELEPSVRIYGQQMDALVDEVRDLLREASDSTDQPTDVKEYQLFKQEGKYRVMPPKNARRVKLNDILVGLDLNASEFNFIHGGLNTRELQRGICVFTCKTFREEMHTLIATKRTPIMPRSETEKLHKVPRLFSMYVPMNRDENAAAFEGNRKIIEMAIRFPNIPSHETTSEHFTQIDVFNEDRLESQPHFREYLTGKNAKQETEDDRKAG